VHDQVIPLSWVKAFYQRLPHYQWHALDKASHMVHLERSVEVNRLLSQFCSS
jgi:pimeloyl-ACP methyl ester carboxylesterase